MTYTKQPTRCATCKREGLTPDDFPRSAKGYIYGECLWCNALRVDAYREALRRDPMRLQRHRAKERARQRKIRERRGYGG